MGRAPCCDKANVKKGPWAPEEDAKLKAYIEKHGTGGNWIALPQKIGLKRCGKSCRLRWLNYLRPNIKHGGFTEEEDNIICSLYISIGSRWSIIAAQLPGRTDNDIKNYWNTRLKKKLLGRRKQSQMNQKDVPNNCGSEENALQNLSNSALERLQLHMQLQTLQNPFSFYNNPALWPKLNPLQERMIQALQQQQISPPNSADQQPAGLLMGQNGEFLDQATISDRLQHELLGNSINNNGNSNDHLAGMSSVDPNLQLNSVFSQAEIDNFLNAKGAVGEGFTPEFDGLKEVWWNNINEIDTNSPSSTSWDSTSQLLHHQQHQPEGMYQNYAIGYNM